MPHPHWSCQQSVFLRIPHLPFRVQMDLGDASMWIAHYGPSTGPRELFKHIVAQKSDYYLLMITFSGPESPSKQFTFIDQLGNNLPWQKKWAIRLLICSEPSWLPFSGKQSGSQLSSSSREALETWKVPDTPELEIIDLKRLSLLRTNCFEGLHLQISCLGGG